MNLSNWQTNVIKNIDDEIDNIAEQAKHLNKNGYIYGLVEGKVAKLREQKRAVEVLDKLAFEKMLSRLDFGEEILLSRFDDWAKLHGKDVLKKETRQQFCKEMGISAIRRQRRYINQILVFNKIK